MSKFDRLLLELNLIRSKPGINAAEIAQETGVSQRTIYRDILALAAQYPLLNDDGYRMLPTAYLKTLNLTPPEYRLLKLAFSCPAVNRPDLRLTAKSLKSKIDTVVDQSIKDFTDFSPEFFPVYREQKPELRRLRSRYSQLEKAIQESRRLELTLPDRVDQSTELFEPYFLVYYLNEWCLVGYLPSRQEFEGVKVSQIEQLARTDQTFQKDPHFSLHDFFGSRWGTEGGEDTVVKVRFCGQAASEILSSPHHPGEKITQTGDREVFYSVTIKGTTGITRWIKGFGVEAEVLAPSWLREQMGREIRAMAKVYSEDRAVGSLL
jgi:predicted DNA-binding transcriptional regulator YafY